MACVLPTPTPALPPCHGSCVLPPPPACPPACAAVPIAAAGRLAALLTSHQTPPKAKMPLRGRVLPAPPRRRRVLPAASRRPRGVLRRYAAVPIAEVGHSAAQRLPTHACVRVRGREIFVRSRPAPSAGVALVRPRASGGLQDTYPPRYLARARAGYRHRSQISRLGARAPRRVNHKTTTDRRMPRGDHGQDSRRPTCCDGCAGEARPWSRTGSKRPSGHAAPGDRTRAAKNCDARSAPRIGTGAARPVDAPARYKTLPSPHGPRKVCRRCPVHRVGHLRVGLQAQDKRSTNRSIERCLGSPAEQVVRASSSSQSGAAPSPDGRLRVPSDAWEEAGVERRAQREGGVRGSHVQMPLGRGQAAHGHPRPRPDLLHLDQAPAGARSGIRRTARQPRRSPPLRARSPGTQTASRGGRGAAPAHSGQASASEVTARPCCR